MTAFDQATFDKEVTNMPALLRGFVFYAKYHWEPVNQWIHIFCVWPILATAIMLFGYLPLPEAAAALLPKNEYIAMDNFGFVIGCLYLAWHFYLDLAIGLVANSLVIAILVGNTMLHGSPLADDAVMWLWAIHGFCWLAQFWGHGVHERRRPALLENLFASVFMAPIFVVIEVLCKLGFLREFHTKLTALVQPEVEHYRAQLDAAAGKTKDA